MAMFAVDRGLYLEKKMHAQRRRRTPWLAQEITSPSSAISYSTPIRQQLKTLIAPLLNSSRQQQLHELVEIEKSEAEIIVDRNLAISTMMMGVTVAGSLIYWPINLLALPGLFAVATPIYKSAYQSIRSRRIGIEVADSVAITIIFSSGQFLIGTLGAFFYFASKKLLLKTEDHSKRKLVNVFGEQPRSVWILVDGIEVQIPFAQLAAGDTVILHAGQTIPVDGRVIQGQATVDQQMLTGESQPVDKGSGDPCFASTIVLTGQIYVAVEKAGTETVAAQIGKILNNTADFKETMLSKGQELADRSALPMLLLGALSVPAVGIIGGATVLNSSFGYSLRMVSPIMMLNFLSIASHEGILIKDGRSLELLSKVDTIVFDKTGTLTLAQPHVGKIHTLRDLTEEQLLTFAAAAEYKQTHPIALAILQEAKRRQLTLPAIDEAEYEVGYGIKVTLDEQTIHVGSTRFMQTEMIVLPPIMQTVADYAYQEGNSFVYVAVDGQLSGAIELHPTIRPEAKRIAAALRQSGMELYILSGDNEDPTRRLARELGIGNYFAEVLPGQKANLIASLQQQKKTVCFVGDGINDAIALRTADVSISLRGASTIAIDTAQIIFMDETLNHLTLLLDLGEQFDQHTRINLLTSVVPSIVTIGGVFIFGFGIGASVLINQLGLLAGIGNAMRPLLTYQQTNLPT